LIARGVSRPLELLASAARRVAKGDYRPITGIGRRDEISELASALNGMTEAVAERESELKRAVISVEAARTEAVKANEAKSQFLSNMSHELRTPLNAIVGFSEMIRDQLLGPINVARYVEYARHIFDSGSHLAAQFEQMLHLADAESGTLHLDHRLFAPGHLVESSVSELSAEAKLKGITVDVRGDFSAWPAMQGDEVKLHQSFTNLIHNAIKFSHANETVSVIGMSDRRSMKLVIVDCGIGIKREDLALVMQPFHRGRRAFDATHQGAGLGLPFAKSIIEMHGGSLAIESEEGVGTTVTVSLPAMTVPELADAA
jgi:signal transduction histidine kinase